MWLWVTPPQCRHKDGSVFPVDLEVIKYTNDQVLFYLCMYIHLSLSLSLCGTLFVERTFTRDRDKRGTAGA
jgi:hypothetical protein